MRSQRHSVLGSAVFQTVLAAGAAVVGVVLLVIWAGYGLFVWQMSQAQFNRIADAVAEAEDIYYGQGAEQLVDFLTYDGGKIWSDDVMLSVREDDELIYVLRTPDYDPIVGFPGFHSADDWQIVDLDHQDIDRQVRAFKSYLRGGATLTVGAFLPERRFETLALAWFASYALVICAIFLVPILGWFASRSVLDRVARISQTTDAVATGAMAERVAMSGRGDEFDRLGGEVNRMLDQVSRLNRNIEAVSVGVAHDLRTPLSNIGGRLELIARDQTDPAAVAEHVTAAESYLSQLLRIFDAILRLGEVEAGKRQADFGQVDFSRLVAEMGESYDAVFSAADKSLAVEVAADVTVEGDRELLEQLLSNLLENAVEHSRDAAKVTLTLMRAADGVALQVADDGPGISPADRDRIFDRFFRADSSRTTPGNGLGLSLVKAIADLHQADIRVDDNAGGAAFTLTFAQKT